MPAEDRLYSDDCEVFLKSEEISSNAKPSKETLAMVVMMMSVCVDRDFTCTGTWCVAKGRKGEWQSFYIGTRGGRMDRQLHLNDGCSA